MFAWFLVFLFLCFLQPCSGAGIVVGVGVVQLAFACDREEESWWTHALVTPLHLLSLACFVSSPSVALALENLGLELEQSKQHPLVP